MNKWGLSQGHKDFLVSTNQSVWFYCCCSVTELCLTLCNPIDCNTPGFSVLHHLLEFAQTYVHWVKWCYSTISSWVTPFSSCLQSFPSSFPVGQLFASGGQSTGASASILPMNIQGCFPLAMTGLISLLPKGLSRIFSSTTTQKHQFFSAQPSLWSNSHICILKRTLYKNSHILKRTFILLCEQRASLCHFALILTNEVASPAWTTAVTS